MPANDNFTIMETEIYASGKFPLLKRIRAACTPCLQCYQFTRGKVEIKLTKDVVTFRVNPHQSPCFDTCCAGEDVQYNDFSFKPQDYSGVYLNIVKGCMCSKSKGTVRVCFGPPPTPLPLTPMSTVIQTKETGVAKNAFIELELFNNADIAKLLNVVSLMADIGSDPHKGMRKGIADGVFPSDVVINRENSASIKGATAIEKDFLPLGADETICTGFKPSRGIVALLTDRQFVVANHPCCSRSREIFCYPIQKASYVSMLKIPFYTTFCGKAIFSLNFQKLKFNFNGKKSCMIKFFNDTMKYLIANGAVNVDSQSDDPARCVLPRIDDEVTHYTFTGTAQCCGAPVKGIPACCPLWNLEVSNYFVRITQGANEYCVPIKNVTGWHINRMTHRKGKCEICRYGGKESGNMTVEMIAKGLEVIPQVLAFTRQPLADADKAIEFIEAWFDALQ